MSKAVYVGVDAKAHKVKAVYVGVDGIARKVKKAYVGVNGKARLCYAANPFASYSGKYTVSDVEVDGKPCKLYTLTTSGTLVLDDEIQCWMCGGGASGAVYTTYGYNTYSGGGGGGGYIANGMLSGGSHVVTIGAGGKSPTTNYEMMHTAGSATKVGSVTAGGARAGTKPSNGVDAAGSSGYSGGGGAAKVYDTEIRSYAGAGGGSGNTALAYPFGLTSLKAHSAGGGAGGIYGFGGAQGARGGAGGSLGSNGENGSGALSYPDAYHISGSPGTYGGGKGGGDNVNSNNTAAGLTGTNATFYGSGGGGGAEYNDGASKVHGRGGAGYQGVVYLLAPV